MISEISVSFYPTNLDEIPFRDHSCRAVCLGMGSYWFCLVCMCTRNESKAVSRDLGLGACVWQAV